MKSKKQITIVMMIILLQFSCNNQIEKGSTSEQRAGIDRTILPIVPPEREPITELDARNATAPEPFEVKAPKDAPNVVIVLIDDIGFGATSTFGGAISTPSFDRLADNGLRFTQFHTTALCSPTRASLLSGRNHHAVNVGSVMEVATGFPGNNGRRPANALYVAEILRQNGYSTAAFGKWHETAPWEVSVSGPYTRWPTNSGFDKFYGFIGGETNQYHPARQAIHGILCYRRSSCTSSCT
jgi:arylsulfatase